MGSVGPGSMLAVTEKEVGFTPFSLSWIPSSARLTAVGSTPAGEGVLKVYSLNGRELAETGSVTSELPLRCGTFDVCELSERLLCCGDFSGNLGLWDVETLVQTETCRAHADIVNSVAGGGVGSSEILTGGRDGEVKLWDRRCLEKPVVRMFPESGETRRDCWSVSHSGLETKLVCSGFDNGDIKVFDLKNLKILWETSVSKGVSNVTLSPGKDCTRLYAGTVQGRLYSWDVNAPAETISTQLDKSTVWETQVIGNKVISVLGSGAICVAEQSGDKLEMVLNHQNKMDRLSSVEEEKDGKFRERKIVSLEPFPVDDTPTPTKILRMANDLFPDFQDPKENPFDAHFRKAAEAVKSGSDRLAASIAANEIPAEDSLNTPSIFPTSALNTPTPTLKRSISKQSSARTVAARNLKPLLPNGPVQNNKQGEGGTGNTDCQVLLKLPSGDTYKLYNLPMVQDGAESSPSPEKKTAVTRSPKKPPDLQEPAAEGDSADPEEDRRRELLERNRYSAKRSRNRKRELYDKMVAEGKRFSIENNVLRQEIIRLKNMLQKHVECDVTVKEGQQDVIRMMIEPLIMITCPLPQPPQKIKHVPIAMAGPQGQQAVGTVPPSPSTNLTRVQALPVTQSDGPGQEGLVFSAPELAAPGEDRVTGDLTSQGPSQRILVTNNQIEFSPFIAPNIKLLLPPKPGRQDLTSAKQSLDREDGVGTPSDKIIVPDPLSVEIKEALTTRELDSLKKLKRQSDALMDETEGSRRCDSPAEAQSPPRVLSPPQVFPEDLRTAKSPEMAGEPGAGTGLGSAPGPALTSDLGLGLGNKSLQDHPGGGVLKTKKRAVKRVRAVKEPGARKKPLVQQLTDKLEELKRKMTEDDRATDEFLSALRGGDKPSS